MQNVGQTAFAPCRCQQVFRNMASGHQRAQHRHHTASIPDLSVAIKFLNNRIPGFFVSIQRFNILRIQSHH